MGKQDDVAIDDDEAAAFAAGVAVWLDLATELLRQKEAGDAWDLEVLADQLTEYGTPLLVMAVPAMVVLAERAGLDADALAQEAAVYRTVGETTDEETT